MYGLKAVPFREASFSAAFGAAVDPPLGSLGCRWLFCDRDRVGHRIVVKLSFARAEGRNYRQLPDRARLREEPAPADFIYSKRYSLFQLDVSGSMSFFWHGSTKGKVTSGLLCALAAGRNGQQNGFCGSRRVVRARLPDSGEARSRPVHHMANDGRSSV
jgi:hypothetical protein